MGWISPNDLHEDPKQWLNVSHEFHEVLTRLMSKMFEEDWSEVLIRCEIHCYKCEGKGLLIGKKDGDWVVVDGHVGSGETVMYHFNTKLTNEARLKAKALGL